MATSSSNARFVRGRGESAPRRNASSTMRASTVARNASASARDGGMPLALAKGAGSRGATAEMAARAVPARVSRRRSPARVADSAAPDDSSNARSTACPRSTSAGYVRTSAPETCRAMKGGSSPKSHDVSPLRSQPGDGARVPPHRPRARPVPRPEVGDVLALGHDLAAFVEDADGEAKVAGHGLGVERLLGHVDAAGGREGGGERGNHGPSNGASADASALGRAPEWDRARGGPPSEARGGAPRSSPVPTRHRPIELARVELRQEHEGHRERDAVVVRRGIELVGHRDLRPVQEEGVRIVAGHEARDRPPGRPRARARARGVSFSASLAPDLERWPFTTSARRRADRRTRGALRRPPSCRSGAPCRAGLATSRGALAVLLLEGAARPVLAAHERVLEEHPARLGRRNARVVHAAIRARGDRRAWRAP